MQEIAKSYYLELLEGLPVPFRNLIFAGLTVIVTGTGQIVVVVDEVPAVFSGSGHFHPPAACQFVFQKNHFGAGSGVGYSVNQEIIDILVREVALSVI